MGLAAAELFAREGAQLVLAGRDVAAGEAAVQHLRPFCPTVAFVPTNVSQGHQVQHLIAETVRRFGQLDIAFNNAGQEGRFFPITEQTEADFDAVAGANLKGVWLCCRQELLQFQVQGSGGVIVNNSSWLSKGVTLGSSTYSATKAGVDGLTRALAVEAAALGVRVNSVNPGYIVTPMLGRFVNPHSPEAAPLLRHAPLGRFASAAEVAEAVLWLSSPAAAFVTGQCLSIDGGLTIAYPR